MNPKEQSKLTVLCSAIANAPNRYEQFIEMTFIDDYTETELRAVVNEIKTSFGKNGWETFITRNELKDVVHKMLLEGNSDAKLAGKALAWAMERRTRSTKKGNRKVNWSYSTPEKKD